LATEAPGLAPGALTDIAGLRVGHAAAPGRPTGCSVVLCPQGVICGAAVRGGAPGTRETELLRPENTVEAVHAVLLTGGSAYGLDAAGGVMRWLEERGHGLVVGKPDANAYTGQPIRVPIVPAAVLFDLGVGDPRIRPDAQTGYAACEAACEASSSGPPRQGSVGAGLGATVGKLHGAARATKGGIGTASLRLGAHTVAALVAVNAIGEVLGGDGRVLAGVRAAAPGAAPDHPAIGPGMATTIGVVATDAVLTKAQATQLASQAHHGLSRTVRPITPHDGDTFFALATAALPEMVDFSALCALAADVVSLAIRNGVLAATGVSADSAVSADTGLPLPATRDVG
jgi:L-aminopeptidase/D-esterase-like protein